MIKSNNKFFLYRLIERLNPSERRYFKVMSKHHTLGKHNHYVKLFDIITGHLKSGGPINEQMIRTSFEKTTGKARFDLYKVHLYEKIIAALEAFHRSNHVTLQLRSQINKADLLNRKGLPLQALKLIKKAKQTCQKNEHWFILLELLELERQITYAIQAPSVENKQELDVLDILQVEGRFRNIQSQLWKNFLEHGLPTNEPAKERYSQLLKDDVFLVREESTSLAGNIIRLYCQQFVAGMEGKIELSYDYGRQLHDLMNQHPSYMSDKGALYIRCLMNWQYTLVRLNKWDELMSSYEICQTKLNSYPLAPSFKHSIQLSLLANKYDLSFKLSKREHLNAIIEKMDNYIAPISSGIGKPTLLMYYWQKATHAFVTRDFKSILDWTGNIYSLKTPFRQDIQGFSRILDLIAYFELGQSQILKSYTLNTYRYLKKKDRLMSIEKFLIQFIRKGLSRKNTLTPLEFGQVFSDLKKLKKNDQSHESLLLMYFEDWLKEKVEN